MSNARWISTGLLLALSFGCASPQLPNPFGAQRDPAKILDAYRDQRAEKRAIQDEALAEQRTRAVPVSDLVAEGDRYRAQDRLGDALFLYLRAVKAAPSSLGPKLRIGFLHLRDDPARAGRIFEAIASESPDAALAHAGLGMAELALGHDDRALEAFERSIAIDPASATTWNALGVVRDRSGARGAAQEAYREAIALEPESERAWVNLGASHLFEGQIDAALEALERADGLAPRDPFVRAHLGLAYGRLGRIDDAFAAFRSVSGEARARNNLGYVLYLNGSFEAAMLEFERALAVPAEELPAVLRNWEAARMGPERARLAAEHRAAEEAMRAAAEAEAIEAQRLREEADAAHQAAEAVRLAEVEAQRAAADRAAADQAERATAEARHDDREDAGALAESTALEAFVGPLQPIADPHRELDAEPSPAEAAAAEPLAGSVGPALPAEPAALDPSHWLL